MTMRKPLPRKSPNQFDLPFGTEGNLALKPEANKAPTNPPKEIKMPPVSEVMKRYASPEPETDNDKDEDPRAQAAREWKQYRGGRRA